MGRVWVCLKGVELIVPPVGRVLALVPILAEHVAEGVVVRSNGRLLVLVVVPVEPCLPGLVGELEVCAIVAVVPELGLVLVSFFLLAVTVVVAVWGCGPPEKRVESIRVRLMLARG